MTVALLCLILVILIVVVLIGLLMYHKRCATPEQNKAKIEARVMTLYLALLFGSLLFARGANNLLEKHFLPQYEGWSNLISIGIGVILIGLAVYVAPDYCLSAENANMQ